MGEGDKPGTVWGKSELAKSNGTVRLRSYSRGVAGLGVLLATTNLQEVQHVLGQLLVVVQDTLPCIRGSQHRPPSPPQKTKKTHKTHHQLAPYPNVKLQALPALLQHFGHPVGDTAGREVRDLAGLLDLG